MLFEKTKTKNKTKTPIWGSQAVLGDNESCVHGCFWWKACFILLLLFEDLGEGWGRGHCFPERVAGAIISEVLPHVPQGQFLQSSAPVGASYLKDTI